ncbi:endocuticle structural glycoprotein SgAbd-3-like [Ostrinia furnacalis]|uniref:endocuticle structural glycoprotein SgAbd-3-like n=1 Tax=Ostrinia furnacalis TaxID=93504 RepID=UPI00103E9730|nr:endocuticle structural glycoprotein SgAbd-3-like [Ostrinia furnacalis]
MKYLIILALASVATAAKLDKVYLPPNAQSSGGANAGLQAPFGASGPSSFASSGPQSYSGASASSNAEILKYENEINEDGYHYAYETSDGTKAEQEGRVLPGAAPEEGSLKVSGSYSYVGDDGQTYTITYTADENGYHAEGAHLPTPPPIPEAILKSLQLNDGVREHYDSQKSSYDADAGY